MSKYAILGTLAAAIGTVLVLQSFLTIREDTWLGIIMLVGGVTVWSLLVYARSNRNPFTPDQMKLIEDMIQGERLRIKTLKQQIIDEGAEVGKTISTDSVLQKLEALKASHTGPDREAFIWSVDRLAKDFREKYGPTIPVDVAYKLLTEYEEKYGRLDD